MEQVLNEARKLVLQMNGSPKDRLSLSKNLLKLLENVPDSRKTFREIELCRDVVSIAKDTKEKVRELYDNDKFMYEALEQVTYIDMFIRSREPSFSSIH